VVGVAEVPVPVPVSLVVPVLVPLWPDGLLVPVAPVPIDEPDVVSESMPVDLQAVNAKAMMPPSRAVCILFIVFSSMWMGQIIMRGA
jgi:hypothetical protein